jgi:phosphatidylinositol alpha 1,6-mannosyltransferase
VFVHTGETETFCQTIQEAQASGVPVVAPAAGGPLDLIESGLTGLLFDPADPASLRDSVAELVRSAHVRADLAARGLRRVATRGWHGVVQELIDQHYAAVLADAGDRAAA